MNQTAEIVTAEDDAPLTTTQGLEDMVSDWLRSLDGSEDTRRTYRRALEQFQEWYEDEQRAALDGQRQAAAGVVRDFRDHLAEEYSAASVNLKLSALRSFLDYCVKSGMVEANPADAVEGLKRSGTTKRHKRDELTPDEINRMIEDCQDQETTTGVRDRAIIGLMAYTGLRTVEVHRANIADIETDQGRTILWVQGKGESGKDDFVVLPEQAERMLSDWMAERPDADEGPLFVSTSPRNRGDRLSRHAIRTMIKRRMDAAGIVSDRKSAHSLRHSAISSAIRNGADPEQAQGMARHANITTTMTYYHEIDRVENPAEDLIDYGGDQ
jgi:integrase/recombinase XerC/integrase/recombinase XerD